MPYVGALYRDPGPVSCAPCRRFLPCEAFAHGAAGIIQEVWIFGERFQLIFHLRRNRHLTARAGSRAQPRACGLAERAARISSFSQHVIDDLADHRACAQVV